MLETRESHEEPGVLGGGFIRDHPLAHSFACKRCLAAGRNRCPEASGNHPSLGKIAHEGGRTRVSD